VAVQAFEQNAIQGAWVPEPYATRLVTQDGAKVLVDERTLWPAGRFVTTNLVVRTDYLSQHPDIVQGLLEANVDAIALINASPTQAEQLVGTRIQRDTGKPLAENLIVASFKDVLFTADPVASSLVAGAKTAAALGLPSAAPLTRRDVEHLYNLKLLNIVLKAKRQPPIAAPRA
jgi:NitT/TauT family transport system substrate-binding protein